MPLTRQALGFSFRLIRYLLFPHPHCHQVLPPIQPFPIQNPSGILCNAVNGELHYLAAVAGGRDVELRRSDLEVGLHGSERIRYLGAGRNLAEAIGPLVLEAKGVRIGLLAFSCLLPQGASAGEGRPGGAARRDRLLGDATGPEADDAARENKSAAAKGQLARQKSILGDDRA